MKLSIPVLSLLAAVALPATALAKPPAPAPTHKTAPAKQPKKDHKAAKPSPKAKGG